MAIDEPRVPDNLRNRWVQLPSGSFTINNMIIPVLHAVGMRVATYNIVTIELNDADLVRLMPPHDTVFILDGWDDIDYAKKEKVIDLVSRWPRILVAHRWYLRQEVEVVDPTAPRTRRKKS